MLSLTGCAGQADKKVASAQDPSHPSSATSSSTATPDARQFAACLRARGIDVADPRPGGNVQLTTKDDKTRAAIAACQQYAPTTTDRTDNIDPESARSYAACIRGKGFPDFPDPDASGPRIPKELIHDQRFNAADRDCSRLLIGSGGKK
jgi:hypothetical protein